MLFDYSKSGMINVRDIGPVVRSVGLKPSQAEIRSIMADVQQSGMVLLCLFFQNLFLSSVHTTHIYGHTFLHFCAHIYRLYIPVMRTGHLYIRPYIWPLQKSLLFSFTARINVYGWCVTGTHVYML